MTQRWMITAALLGLAATACTHPSSRVYQGDSVGTVQDTVQATVVQTRKVDIHGGNRGLGAAAGGVSAGAVAAEVAGGSGARTVITLLSGMAGAGAGYLAEGEARSRSGVEYTVRMPDGEMKTIVQNLPDEETPVTAGRRVLIQMGGDYTRVVPLGGPDQQNSRQQDQADNEKAEDSSTTAFGYEDL